MTVNVSKPAINVREKLAELDKPTGIAGEAMLRAETPQEQFNLIGAGRRNLIINGGLDVWQRSTSSSALGLGYFAADRFWSYAGVSGTVERSTDAPDGFNYSLYWNRTNGGSMGTSVELTRQGHNPYGMLTYSMYVKGDFTNTALYFNFRNYSGGAVDTTDIKPVTDFGNYPDWTRVVIPVDCTGIAAHANNKMLNIEFAGFPAGGKITGVQLELGKVATPFEHRSYGEELALCQRYYYKTDTIIHIVAPRYSGSAGAGNAWWKHPVYMRTSPSMSYHGTWYVTSGYGGAPTFGNNTKDGVALTTSINTTANGVLYLTGGQISGDAEL